MVLVLWYAVGAIGGFGGWCLTAGGFWLAGVLSFVGLCGIDSWVRVILVGEFDFAGWLLQRR